MSAMLGFDTSLAVTSVCLTLGDGTVHATPAPPVERLYERPQHSAELLPAIADLLTEAELGWEAIGSIAVGIGPGTFTGLRIGVATARALGQARSMSLRPVCSLDSLAAGMRDDEPTRPLLATIDARRGEVFAALYEGGPTAPTWGPVALTPDALMARLPSGGETILAAGDWALESREVLQSADIEVALREPGRHSVEARWVCALARDIEPVAPEAVEPLYVRLPDAEINRRAAQGGA